LEFFVSDVCSAKKSRKISNQATTSFEILLEYVFFQWKFHLFGLRHRQPKFGAKFLKKHIAFNHNPSKKSRKLGETIQESDHQTQNTAGTCIISGTIPVSRAQSPPTSSLEPSFWTSLLLLIIFQLKKYGNLEKLMKATTRLEKLLKYAVFQVKFQLFVFVHRQKHAGQEVYVKIR
jgi:hypothetical protein